MLYIVSVTYKVFQTKIHSLYVGIITQVEILTMLEILHCLADHLPHKKKTKKTEPSVR